MSIRDITSYLPDGRPWLICGKGPSFNSQLLKEKGGASYNILTLNETIRETDAEFAHIIDCDVIGRVSDDIYKRSKYLVMPYFPHFKCRPNPELSIERVIELNFYPVIGKMAEEGRLLCYNLSTIRAVRPNSPVIRANHYSAEAAVHLLAELGMRDIRTLGVDGGHAQSSTFNDLDNTNLEKGYDLQWKNIRRCIRKYRLNYGPIDVDCPIRIFVGCSPSERIPYEVLKWTIEKYATMSVSVEPLSNWMDKIPEVHDVKLKQRTPFSFQRFLIPELCEYKGRAIYLDSDMQVFSDIKSLWTEDFQGKKMVVPRPPDTDRKRAQFSVMLLDCSRLDWDVNEIVEAMNDGLFSYEQIMHEMIISDFRDNACPEWNALETYEKGVTKLLHYTNFHTQPWKLEAHPLSHLWEEAFKECLAYGRIDPELVRSHVTQGYLRPSLLSFLPSS